MAHRVTAFDNPPPPFIFKLVLNMFCLDLTYNMDVYWIMDVIQIYVNFVILCIKKLK